MKRQVATLDAVPSKRLFLSIIADYDLNKSICELVDNGFDVWIRAGKAGPIAIDVWLDEEERTIRVVDSAGGLPREELKFIVGPGQSGSEATDETIGIFGVGTKRAVVALAKQVRITTRYSDAATHQIEFDDLWLEEEEWELPLYQVSDIDAGTTQVELQQLRVAIGDEQQALLRDHLGATYAKFLLRDDVVLRLNGIAVAPRFFDRWSYPPDYPPRRYHGTLRVPSGRDISVEVLAGLSNESSPASGEYGVYFYCNDRLVAPAMKSFDVGFTRGQAGLPHPKISLTKVIVSLRGDAAEMPWNSSKSDISTKHHVFVALHDWLVTVVRDYAAVSRAWQGLWPDKVFAHATGTVVDTPIDDFLTARRSFLPDPPKSKPRLAERVAKRNQKLVEAKPWTAGLYEGVVASAIVAKQPLRQANWLAFHLIDLTITTALKDYVVHEANEAADEAALRDLLSEAGYDRLRATVPLPDELWQRAVHLRARHDDLLFGRAEPTIADAELDAAHDLAEAILARLFAIKGDG